MFVRLRQIVQRRLRCTDGRPPYQIIGPKNYNNIRSDWIYDVFSPLYDADASKLRHHERSDRASEDESRIDTH